jgi:Bacterial regulatory proteins, tetR family
MDRDSIAAPAPRTGRWRSRRALTAALRVFACRGYRDASVDEIAAVAGYSKGALLHFSAELPASTAFQASQPRSPCVAGMGVSLARYVPRSDARIVQKYRLAA